MWIQSSSTSESLRVIVTNPATQGEITVTLNGQAITSPASGTSVTTTVNSRRSSEYKITGTQQMAGTSSSTTKGYHLKANADVLVQAFNPQGDGCGSMMVVPKDALGSDYFILTSKPITAGSNRLVLFVWSSRGIYDNGSI